MAALSHDDSELAWTSAARRDSWEWAECTLPFAALRVAGRTNASVPTLGSASPLLD